MNAIKTVIKSLKNDGIKTTFTKVKQHIHRYNKTGKIYSYLF